MVGVAWVTVCWGVMVCIKVGHADGGDSLPSHTLPVKLLTVTS